MRGREGGEVRGRDGEGQREGGYVGGKRSEVRRGSGATCTITAIPALCMHSYLCVQVPFVHTSLQTI